jgi:hypothetical protein
VNCDFILLCLRYFIKYFTCEIFFNGNSGKERDDKKVMMEKRMVVKQ